MMLDMIIWAVDQRWPVALYTQRRMLYEQTCKALDRAGIDYGKRASGHAANSFPDVQMCMTQTELSAVYKREYRKLHHAKLVLIDEMHQFCGATCQKIMADHITAGAACVGYTATPLDLEGVDELLVAGWMSECLKIGALVKPETYAPDEPDLRHIKKYVVGHELTESQNVKSIMRPGVFGRVLTAWKKHNPDGKPTLLFGPDVAGSLFFAQEFQKMGIEAAHVDGEQIWMGGEFHPTDDETRTELARRSKAGEIKVVCNRYVLREGISWNWLECGIFATVFGALTSYLQSAGRLLRACPETGKSKTLILDHGGSWHRHGSIAVDRHWQLGMTNQREVAERQEKLRDKKDEEPITCPQCGKVRQGGPTCPACGLTMHPRARMVVQVDGTLKKVSGDVYKPRREAMKPDTQQLWERIYYRARSQKWNATFRQAQAMFFRENHYWPPKTLRLMPKEGGDFFRKVADVSKGALNQ
jgi:superfamily II DNA or RNA helicase